MYASVAKLVDAPDLGSGVLRRVGSSPIGRTKKSPSGYATWTFFLLHLLLVYRNSTGMYVVKTALYK